MNICEEIGCNNESAKSICEECVAKAVNHLASLPTPEPSQLDQIVNLLIGVVAREKLIEQKLDRLLNTPSEYAEERRAPYSTQLNSADQRVRLHSENVDS